VNDGGVNAAMMAASAATSAAASGRGMITLWPAAAGQTTALPIADSGSPNPCRDGAELVSVFGRFL
jgi:hypothetical protein